MKKIKMFEVERCEYVDLLEEVLTELVKRAAEGGIPHWNGYDIIEKAKAGGLTIYTLRLHLGPIQNPRSITASVTIHYLADLPTPKVYVEWDGDKTFNLFLQKFFVNRYGASLKDIERLVDVFGANKVVRVLGHNKTLEEAAKELVLGELQELGWDEDTYENLFDENGFLFETHIYGRAALFCEMDLPERRKKEVEVVCDKAGFEVIWEKYDPANYI